MPEFEGVNCTLMAWADFYISMHGVSSTLSDMTNARAEYVSVLRKHSGYDHYHACRYVCWHKYQDVAAWLGSDEDIGFHVPKGHQFAHMLAFMWMFAPVDAAQLNNLEHHDDHIKNVKDSPMQADKSA